MSLKKAKNQLEEIKDDGLIAQSDIDKVIDEWRERNPQLLENNGVFKRVKKGITIKDMKNDLHYVTDTSGMTA